jgi:hypothetical protein
VNQDAKRTVAEGWFNCSKYLPNRQGREKYWESCMIDQKTLPHCNSLNVITHLLYYWPPHRLLNINGFHGKSLCIEQA